MGQFDLNALSGINASSEGLAVIANNLSNAQTMGFKSSRTEFGDLFSGAQSSAGNGVKVSSINQNFQQGTINGTGRDLDMAVDGEGFFVIEDITGKYDQVYTRNGSFKLDADGYLTTQGGDKVLGYPPNDALSAGETTIFQTVLEDINLADLNRIPQPTDEVSYNINLDAMQVNNRDQNNADTDTDSVGTGDNLLGLVDPENNAFAGIADFSTSQTIHDSLGGEHRLTSNFFKRDVVTSANSDADYDGDGNNDKYTSWIVQYTVETYNENSGEYETSGRQATRGPTDGTAASDGEFAGQVFELRFDANGALAEVREPDDPQAPTGLDDTANPNEALDSWTPVDPLPVMSWIIDTPMTGAADPLGSQDQSTDNVQISIDFDDMTQYAGEYNLRGVTQNGYAIGDLVGLITSGDGVIQARYSNGRSIAVAQLGMATFSDKNAMEKLGDQMYAETFGSGTVQLGVPQESGFGSINSGALEYSNVDTAAELVQMIQTQRTYQASAQVISTSQELMQRVLQL